MSSAAKRTHWLGIDLGGTKLLACVLNKDFRVVGSCKKKTKAEKSAGFNMDRIVETIQEALNEAHLTPSALAGVGVGAAGWLDLDRGILLQAPNLGWRNVPLAEDLGKALKAPTILANDVDAGTYGEYRFGAAKNARCVVGVFPGTGIGGACVYEGRLLRGKTSSCMEIGHMLVNPSGALCGCGLRGCLETVASRLAISAEAAAAAYRGDAPHLLKLAGTNVADIRSGALGQAIAAGDKVVERIVRHAARHLGLALVSVVHLLAPDTILLGGGLVEEMPELFVPEVHDTLKAHALKNFTSSVRIVVAQLGGQATAMGAAALAAEEKDAHA